MPLQENSQKKSHLTFKDYYESIDNKSPRSKLRAEICLALGLAESSLFDKIRNNRWTPIEKEIISGICNEPISHLFPEEIQ
jgi:hypothetical protein